jgi:cytidylate kinase
MLLDMLGVPTAAIPDPWFTHFDEIAALRDSTNADFELDRIMADLARTKDSVVFDSWLLPWTADRPLCKVWIGCSDETRGRKTQLSYSGYPPISIEQSQALISRKDADARRRFASLYGIEFQPTSAKFDVVLDNTSYYHDSNDRRSDQLSKEFTELLLAAISRSPSSR